MDKNALQVKWERLTAYLVGGGDSLRGFDFLTLRDSNVIGCNAAYTLGPDIVKVCVYGDKKFFAQHKFGLEKYAADGGIPVDVSTGTTPPPWTNKIKREETGYHPFPKIGFNYSTGAAAINLAINFGVSRIFLLGYDLKQGEAGRTHWHNLYGTKRTKLDAFKRFTRGFDLLAEGVKSLPVEIFNVTDGSSNLNAFKRITFAQMEAMR